MQYEDYLKDSENLKKGSKGPGLKRILNLRALGQRWNKNRSIALGVWLIVTQKIWQKRHQTLEQLKSYMKQE